MMFDVFVALVAFYALVCAFIGNLNPRASSLEMFINTLFGMLAIIVIMKLTL